MSKVNRVVTTKEILGDGFYIKDNTGSIVSSLPE
jgi:hypothetical protein